MPRLLFIQPTQYGPDGRLCRQDRIHLPGLVFPLLAALTPQRWEVSLCIEVVDKVDFDADVDLVAIGAMGFAVWRGAEIADEFRKRGKKVVFGGYMASMVPQAVLEHADSVVLGDAERSWPRLLQDFERGELQRIYDEPLTSLDGLPLPRYELLLDKPIGTMLPVQAGRGCPHQCSFCSIACIYKGRYLSRPVPEVLRDIQRVKELGFKSFYLLDDNIISNPGFLEELCERIRPLGMTWASQCSLSLARNQRLLEIVAKSGCNLLSFGLESISQEALDSVGKSWVRVADHEELLRRIHAAGIMASTEMILGLDADTEASVKATLEFVERARIAIPRFYILTPIPGSALYDEYQRAGRLVTEDWRRYHGSEAVFNTPNLNAARLTELYWWLNEQTFSLGGILRRTILRGGFWRDPRLHLFALGVNLHYRRYITRHVPPNIF